MIWKPGDLPSCPTQIPSRKGEVSKGQFDMSKGRLFFCTQPIRQLDGIFWFLKRNTVEEDCVNERETLKSHV